MTSTIYIERAENELELAKIIFKITNDENLQENVFLINKPLTFFSSVIIHSYYCIFYSAKAYLLNKGIATNAPEEHKKTFLEFKKLVESGLIDVELLRIYEALVIRADVLLEIFKLEKKKRGEFTYQKLAQSNKEPANNSLNNAKVFFKHIYSLIK